jgi:hypothetical protein
MILDERGDSQREWREEFGLQFEALPESIDV